MKANFIKLINVFYRLISELYTMVICGLNIHFYEYKKKEFKGTDSFGKTYTPKIECRECRVCKKLQIVRCFNGWCWYENF